MKILKQKIIRQFWQKVKLYLMWKLRIAKFQAKKWVFNQIKLSVKLKTKSFEHQWLGIKN